MSWVAFLVLVSQWSNSFNLIAFFHYQSTSLRQQSQNPSFYRRIYSEPSKSSVIYKHTNDLRSWTVRFIFFSSEIFKRFSRWNPNFRKVLQFFSFLFVFMELWICACKYYPCQRQWPWRDQQRLHKSWTFTDCICEIEFSDTYNSINVFFRFTFYYFAAINQSFSFLNAVVFFGWSHLGGWSFQMLRVYWRSKRSPCFTNIPALNLGRFFTGVAARTTAAIFQLNIAIFLVKRR